MARPVVSVPPPAPGAAPRRVSAEKAGRQAAAQPAAAKSATPAAHGRSAAEHARAPAQGPLRRDLLRRPPGGRRARGDPRHPPAPPPPGSRRLRPRAPGHASAGFSGAELEQAVISALLQALQDGRSLDTDLVERELSATVPLSVSRAEDVERLRAFAPRALRRGAVVRTGAAPLTASPPLPRRTGA